MTPQQKLNTTARQIAAEARGWHIAYDPDAPRRLAWYAQPAGDVAPCFADDTVDKVLYALEAYEADGAQTGRK